MSKPTRAPKAATTTPTVSRRKRAKKEPRTPEQIGRGSREKGKTFEREVANALRAIFPNAKRSHGQSREKGEAPDVQGTEFWLECKNHRSLNARKALEQAIEERATKNGATALAAAGITVERETNGAPVVILRHTDKRPDMAIMVAEDWLRMVEAMVRFRRLLDEYVNG